MIKKHVMAGLLFCSFGAMFAEYDHSKLFYLLRQSGLEIGSEQLVADNVDELIEFYEAGAHFKEGGLFVEKNRAINALKYNVALVAGFVMARYCSGLIMHTLLRNGYDRGKSDDFSLVASLLHHIFAIKNQLVSGLFTMTAAYAALNVHDAVKSKNGLANALQLDKDILAELYALKEKLEQQELDEMSSE